jgi:hypothetical protein
MRGRVASRTPLLIVCSPQARVGRTLVARLLIDFFLMEDRPVAGFDFVVEPPSLTDFLPNHAVQAGVADIGAQMALFDRLIVPDRIAKVVDLAPASFQRFFSVMAQIGYLEDARRKGIEPIALFIAAPDAVSQRAYAELQRSLPDLVLVPVYNEAIGQGQRTRKNYPLSRTVSVPIQVPTLPQHFYRYLEQAPFSFADFRGTPPQDIPLDAYMELLRWTRRVFVEFRELELRLLLADVRLSLQHGTG